MFLFCVILTSGLITLTRAITILRKKLNDICYWIFGVPLVDKGIGRKRTGNGNRWFLLRGAITQLMFLASQFPTTATAIAQRVGNDGKLEFNTTSVSLKSGSWNRMAKVASDVGLSNGILIILAIFVLLVFLIVGACVLVCCGVNGDYNFGPRCHGWFHFWVGDRYTKASSSSEERS